MSATSSSHSTQYGLTYQGQPMAGLAFDSKAAAAEYVAAAVRAGNSPEDYGYIHRAVTVGEWAPTTPYRAATVTWHGAPALLAASEDPASPWVVTLPEGHADLGYAPGSQFLATAAELREARQ